MINNIWGCVNMPKISIVVPVYGVEKYIERCARSLFEQTLNDIEYIFVDDCTPDDSISILNKVLMEYPERINSTKIVKMSKNSGLPAVRKYGVSLAKGDYIIACDSDDYVEKEMYEIMFNMAKNNDLDLVQCDIEVVDDEKSLYAISSKKAQLSSEELKTMIIDGDISNSLCNKLVKYSIYHNPELQFPTRNIDEDNVLSVQLAYFSSKLGYINEPYYKAYFNQASMSREPGIDQIISRVEDSYVNSQFIVEFLKSKGYANDSKAIIKAKIRPKQTFLPAVRNIKNVNKWKSIYPEINWKVIFDRRFPIIVKVLFLSIMTYTYPIFKRFKK